MLENTTKTQTNKKITTNMMKTELTKNQKEEETTNKVDLMRAN